MSLAGVEMVFFLPVLLLLYWIGPRRIGWQNPLLLLASILFFASWTPRLLPVLAISILVDWILGRALDAAPEDANPTPRRRLLFGTSLAFNLCLLGFFKYAGFFATSLNDLITAMGLPPSLPVLRLVLPIGISYWTLSKLAYVADVYWGRLRACRSLLTFALHASFFPQLIAGPIVRGQELLPQWSRPRHLTPSLVAGGASAFLLGFALKAWAADWLGMAIATPIFSEPLIYSRGARWIGLLAYAGQIFGDFAGYSFLAIGVGRFFGVELPLNFRYPFLSRSLPELWTRWHITLNRWLFDYIYGPLTTGESFFRGRFQLGFLVVFLASGLWHGAQWTFVLWGLLHGLGLVTHFRWDAFYKSLCRRDRKWVAIRRGAPYAISAWAITQLFFVLTLIPFRTPTLAAAGEYFRLLFVRGGHVGLPIGDLESLANFLAIGAFLVGYHVLELGAL
ncbi:MAG: MBOAT family protein, partial [Gemmatimonadetes bacterium]|nr:MBOAT family protein [Gemmatimonadota bacterium]